jgi:hypothetical protein
LEEKRAVLAGTPRNQNPPVTVSQIRQEKQVWARFKAEDCFFWNLISYFVRFLQNVGTY